MSKNLLPIAAIVVALAALGIFLAVNGSEAEPSPESIDAAFVTGMVPHHEGAIEMAEIANKQADHPRIKKLAREIIASQAEEIKTLNEISDRLGINPAEDQAQGDLDMDDSSMGMEMDMDSLAAAKPFDREFIDQMIPHHQGAIRMSRVVMREGADEETKALALTIVDAQAAEINQMNEWREKWFGAPSPAGGVPRLDEPAPSNDDENEAHH